MKRHSKISRPKSANKPHVVKAKGGIVNLTKRALENIL